MSHEKQVKIDVPQCPKGHGNMQLLRVWELRGKGGGGTTMELWRCIVCGAQTRMQRGLKSYE